MKLIMYNFGSFTSVTAVSPEPYYLWFSCISDLVPGWLTTLFDNINMWVYNDYSM